jgi:hypothetical protein
MCIHVKPRDHNKAVGFLNQMAKTEKVLLMNPSGP